MEYDDPASEDDGLGDENVAADYVAAMRRERRAKDLRDIQSLYGTDTPLGREMLQEIMGRYLLAILPDEAIRELAQMHRDADLRNAT